MATVFTLLFIPAWLCAAASLLLRPGFTRLLAERRPEIHLSPGSPPVGCQQTYTFAESSAIFAEIGYLLKGGFRAVDDPELNTLGRILRIALATALALMAVLAGFVIHDIIISRNC